MRFTLLAIISVLFSAETFAQHRPGRVITTRPDRGTVIVHDRRPDNRPGTVIINRRPDYRPGPVIVGPRYNPNRYSTRVIRTYRRDPVIWNTGFGYSCGAFGDLLVSGRLVHNFRFSQDCYTALEDIRLYGDFCDGEDLFDQSGALEAQFTFDYECRNALGYYY
jgi:hypothetical protein